LTIGAFLQLFYSVFVVNCHESRWECQSITVTCIHCVSFCCLQT